MPRLTGYAALYFDLSYTRAARLVRAYDLRDDIDGTRDKDAFGTLSIIHALRREHLRS